MNRKPTQLWNAPRCSAHCKHTKQPCRNPAVRGKKVCRMHGAFAGAPRGERHGNYRHGRRTIAAKETRRRVREMIRDAETKLATVMHEAGLKPPEAIRRHVAVRMVISELLEKAKLEEEGNAEATKGD
jgi:hypothetical protein